MNLFFNVKVMLFKFVYYIRIFTSNPAKMQDASWKINPWTPIWDMFTEEEVRFEITFLAQLHIVEHLLIIHLPSKMFCARFVSQQQGYSIGWDYYEVECRTDAVLLISRSPPTTTCEATTPGESPCSAVVPGTSWYCLLPPLHPSASLFPLRLLRSVAAQLL